MKIKTQKYEYMKKEWIGWEEEEQWKMYGGRRSSKREWGEEKEPKYLNF